ncbi:MAG: hypothetical protein VZR73_17715 [Acutalibacteraceae bacterium]|nr:hypothetical protein [Acutalibacteraceae bacterium]
MQAAILCVLLFVILCSMFAAASVNNIIAVTGSIEHYFDQADLPEIVVTLRGENDFAEKAAARCFSVFFCHDVLLARISESISF